MRQSHCSRCRTGRPCLSHSWLPFNGHVWLPQEHDLLRKYPDRREKHPQGGPLAGRLRRDHLGRYCFALKGMAFDEIPLGYLDWLAGQDWLRPGPFKARLIAYLGHPCIQKELDAIFAEPAYGDVQHYQRREPMPTPEQLDPMPRRPEDYEPNRQRWTAPAAWAALADFVADADNAFSSETYELACFLEAASQLKAALYYLNHAQLVTRPTPKTIDILRSKYRAWRAACRRTRRHSPESPYYTAQQRLADYMKDARVFAESA